MQQKHFISHKHATHGPESKQTTSKEQSWKIENANPRLEYACFAMI